MIDQKNTDITFIPNQNNEVLMMDRQSQKNHHPLLKLLAVISLMAVGFLAVVFVFVQLLSKPDSNINTDAKEIVISDVSVSNFYKSYIYESVDKNVVFFRNDYAEFSYLPDYEQFIIQIEKTPRDVYFPLAEKKFLEVLAVSETEACKLNVKIGAPIYVDKDFGGKSYPLSFCR